MIAVTLGILVITAVTTLFVNNNRTRSEMEKTSQQIENGRYSTQLLLEDLRLAGYYGELDPASVATPTAMPNACATDSASLTSAIAIPVQGFDNGVLTGASTACSAVLSDLKNGSDILVIRRASTCDPGVGNCDPIDTNTTYFQNSLCATDTTTYAINTAASSSVHQKDCTTTAKQRAYYTNIYFVTNNNKSGDGIPTLKVAQLGVNTFNVSALVAGIDQLQIEYGIDTNADGVPDTYNADPGSYNGCTSTSSPSCQTYWRDVTTIKLNILARNTQTSTGWSDSKTYVLGNKADGTSNSFGPYNDAYKRHAYSTLIRLNNIAGRLE